MEGRLIDVLVESSKIDLENINQYSKQMFQDYDRMNKNFQFASGMLCLFMLIGIGFFCYYSQWYAAIALFCFANASAYLFRSAHAQLLELRDTGANMTNGVFKYATAIIAADKELKELESKRKDG